MVARQSYTIRNLAIYVGMLTARRTPTHGLNVNYIVLSYNKVSCPRDLTTRNDEEALLINVLYAC